MALSLFTEAVLSPSAAPHYELFRTSWLPKVIGTDASQAYEGMADDYVVSLHTGIYRYGPNYSQIVENLARIRDLFDAGNKRVLHQLLDIHQEYQQVFNFHHEDYHDNPEYAYRNCTDYELLPEMPNYQACTVHPAFIAYIKTLVEEDGEEILEYPEELLNSYIEVLASWDILYAIPSFRTCRNTVKRFHRQHGLTDPA